MVVKMAALSPSKSLFSTQSDPVVDESGNELEMVLDHSSDPLGTAISHEDTKSPNNASSQEKCVVSDSSVDHSVPGISKLQDPLGNSTPAENNLSKSKPINMKGFTILHVKLVPLTWSYKVLHSKFEYFGTIKEIRIRYCRTENALETWMTLLDQAHALSACCSISNKEFGHDLQCSLVGKTPDHLEVFFPADFVPANAKESVRPKYSQRTPDPPTWLVMTTRDRCNIIRLSKYLHQRVGFISKESITRFGARSALVMTKSQTQSVMLQHLTIEPNDMLKAVRPHMSFSYVKGVIFHRDLYDFSEEEILDMSPNFVWKVFKVPRTHMIIVTFKNSFLPDYLNFKFTEASVRPYKPRPSLCYNCYGYGHPSRVCDADLICGVCSQKEHGSCTLPARCANCGGDHLTRDKKCQKIYV